MKQEDHSVTLSVVFHTFAQSVFSVASMWYLGQQTDRPPPVCQELLFTCFVSGNPSKWLAPDRCSIADEDADQRRLIHSTRWQVESPDLDPSRLVPECVLLTISQPATWEHSPDSHRPYDARLHSAGFTHSPWSRCDHMPGRCSCLGE